MKVHICMFIYTHSYFTFLHEKKKSRDGEGEQLLQIFFISLLNQILVLLPSYPFSASA